MSHYKLHDIYKDLYFHELDMKEKITNRLQLTFAFHITIITILAYMLRTVDYTSPLYILVMFYGLILIGLVFLAISLYEFINAFWGNTYKALASAQDIEDFRLGTIQHALKLEEYRKNYPDKANLEEYLPENKLNEYIYSEYAKCSTYNTDLNDTRSKRNHTSIKLLLVSMIPFILASICFIGWDMDASSPRKELLVEYNGIELTLAKMPNEVSKNVAREIRAIIEEKIELVFNNFKLQIQENMMPEDELEKKSPSNETPPPPPAPEPPKPRDLIESETPKPSLKGGI